MNKTESFILQFGFTYPSIRKMESSDKKEYDKEYRKNKKTKTKKDEKFSRRCSAMGK